MDGIIKRIYRLTPELRCDCTDLAIHCDCNDSEMVYYDLSKAEFSGILYTFSHEVHGILGFIQGHLEMPPEYVGLDPALNPLKLDHLYVDHRKHKNGIGGILLDAYCAAAREMNSRYTWLYSSPDPKTLNWYKDPKRGFKTIGWNNMLGRTI
ncbi:MAG: GNAT family N-acetyltransferase [Rickettsiales bacterium]|jgi:GNAT superfamily N-acetyltransferase|nr:GNAT family N-acetyltransferase [Rickettsiales bacterium]